MERTMSHHVATVEIARPIEEVFAFISDPQNRLKYDAGLLEVRQTSEAGMEVGMQIVEVRRVGGRVVELPTEVVQYERNHRVGFRSLPGDPSNASGTYTMEAVPAGTRLTLDFTTQPRGFYKLIAPLIALSLNRSIPEGLENMKAVLEEAE
jgi:uncharacterized protein YndB with AHSA1/START domain